MNPNEKPPLLADAPGERPAASSKSRLVKVLVWTGGGLLLAVLLLEIVWVRSWLQRRRATEATGAPAAKALRSTGLTSVGTADYGRADVISIVLSNPVVEQGIKLVASSDDVTTPEIVEGVECHRLPERKTAYAHFAVDPSFKRTNQFDVQAEVEYFDASRGRLDLQYDAWSRHGDEGRFASTARRLTLTGSRQWKTNVFSMPDVRFENRQNENADFRVRATGLEVYLRRITLRRSIPAPDGPYARSNAVSITLATNVVSEGLVLGNDLDSVKYPTNAVGHDCYAVRPGPTGSGYLYVAVDRSFKATQPGPCAVEVEYYSPRPCRFRIEYDGWDDDKSSEYKVTGTVTATAGVWATNSFDVPFPRFRNSQNDEADFRINTFNNRMFFRKVTLRPVQAAP